MSLFRNLLLNKPEKFPRLMRYRIQVGHSDNSYPLIPGNPTSIKILKEAYTYIGFQRAWDALYFYLEWNKAFDAMPDYRISVANAEGTLLFSSEENLNGKTFLSFSANSNDLKAYDAQTVTLQLEAILPVTK